jgi:2-C-methyl-D-erythritol 4-phosphate cytidylyltransferase
MERFAVIIPAAGSGVRFGGDKLGQVVAGKTVLQHSIDAFIDRPDVAAVVVVGREVDDPRVIGCDGGGSRSQSVRRGVEVVQQMRKPPPFVAVHDAARPCVSQNLIDRVFCKAIERGAAVPGVTPTDTIKLIEHGYVIETPPRHELLAVQTPQAMRLDWLLDAYERVSDLEDLTDDVSVLEQVGETVYWVEGDPSNVKVTHADDLQRLRKLLGEQE